MTCNVRDCSISDASAAALVEALKASRNTPPATNDPDGLGSLLGVPCYLTSVNLAHNNFTAIGLRMLLTAFQQWPALQELTILPVVKPLADSGLLTELTAFEQSVRDRAWCDRNDATIAAIAENSASVTELDWADHGLGDDVALRLAEALTSNSTVKRLDLSKNHITDVGARAVMRVAQVYRQYPLEYMQSVSQPPNHANVHIIHLRHCISFSYLDVLSACRSDMLCQ